MSTATTAQQALSTSTTEARSVMVSAKNEESPKHLLSLRESFSLEMPSPPMRNSSLLREGQPILILASWKVVLSQVMFRKSLSISKQVPVFADDSEEHLIEVGMRRSERAQAAQEDPYRAH
jgi:hypothetical protein